MTFIQFFFIDIYRVSSDSMEDTILTGRFICISKINYGCRLPISPLNFSLFSPYGDMIQLPQKRLPGLSELERGAIVVFNFPGDINMPIDDRQVYIKRCVAIAGDTIASKNSYLHINGISEDSIPSARRLFELTSRNEIGKPNGNKIKMTRVYTNESSNFKYLIESTGNEFHYLSHSQRNNNNIQIQAVVRNIPSTYFIKSINTDWDLNNFQDFFIPKEGATININHHTLNLYYDIILNHEGNIQVQRQLDELAINGIIQNTYTFKKNYFFAVGDNRSSSIDSRHWGFVPYEHLIGKMIF